MPCAQTHATSPNALHSADPIVAPLVESGEVKIVAAYYSLDTGRVELLK
jgi:hypothetical protein